MKFTKNKEDLNQIFETKGFGGILGFGNKAAIIVIDFMNAFTDERFPLGSNLDREIEQAQKILTVARQKNVDVIHTVVYYDKDFQDAGVWLQKIRGNDSLVEGSWQVEIDSRIGRMPNEPILLKKYASSFFGTDLMSRLTSMGVDTVILMGCSTSGCVRATAVDAIQYGLRPIIAREAVGDRSRQAHDQALLDLQYKYADVLGTSEIINHLSGASG